MKEYRFKIEYETRVKVTNDTKVFDILEEDKENFEYWLRKVISSYGTGLHYDIFITLKGEVLDIEIENWVKCK